MATAPVPAPAAEPERRIPQEVLRWRERWQDPGERALDLERCRRSLLWWQHRWVYTFDPHGRPNRRRPFPRYPYLVDLSRAWGAGRAGQAPGNMGIWKPRAQVVSWWSMSVATQLLNYSLEPISGFVVSMTVDHADDGGEQSTHESLLGKVRYIWEQLEPWHRAPLEFKRGMVRNPVTGSVLKALPAKRAGRSGQWDFAFLDEMGHVEKSELVMAAASQACPNGQIWTGTPNGMQGALWVLYQEKRPDMQRFFLDWWQIPDRRRCRTCASAELLEESVEWKGLEVGVRHLRDDCAPTDGLWRDQVQDRWRSPWFDKACANLPKVLVSQELERDFTRSAVGRVYGDFRRATMFRLVKLDRQAKHFIWRDFGVGDASAILWVQVLGEQVQILEVYENSGVSAEHYCLYVAWCRGEMQDENGKLWIGEKLAAEFRRAWGEPGRYRGLRFTEVGDPSGRNRDAMLQGWFKYLRRGAELERSVAGGGTETVVVGKSYVKPAPDVSMDDRILTLQWVVERGKLVVNSGTHLVEGQEVPLAERLAICLENYRWPTNESGAVVAATKPRPVHDEFSHSTTALEFGVTFLFGVRRFQAVAIS